MEGEAPRPQLRTIRPYADACEGPGNGPGDEDSQAQTVGDAQQSLPGSLYGQINGLGRSKRLKISIPGGDHIPDPLIRANAMARASGIHVPPHLVAGTAAMVGNPHLLESCGITAVLDCSAAGAGELPAHIRVMRLPVEDLPPQDCMSCVYTALGFMEDVRLGGGRVLVHGSEGAHCITALMTAFALWHQEQHQHQQQQQQQLEQLHEALRLQGLAPLSAEYMNQLREWQERRTQPPVHVRMYRVAPGPAHTPLHLMAKVVAPAQGSACADWGALDHRGAFVVHLPGHLYVWRGNKCPDKLTEGAHRAALLIQKYEGTPAPEPVRQGDEPHDMIVALKPVVFENQMYDDDFKVLAQATEAQEGTGAAMAATTSILVAAVPPAVLPAGPPAPLF